MVPTLWLSLMLLAAPEPLFDAEACGKSPPASCEVARGFVSRLGGKRGLVAFKAARLLYLIEDGQPVDRQIDLRDYDPLVKVPVPVHLRFPVPIALSRRDTGHKLRLADARTPEGEYRICASFAASEYTYFLSVSYPNQRDVDAAIRQRRFDPAALERIRRSQRPGACPDFFSALGGTIGIHGAPTHMARDVAAAEVRDATSLNVTGSDWTLGCLGVENRHIRFLAREVKVGTPILIVP